MVNRFALTAMAIFVGGQALASTLDPAEVVKLIAKNLQDRGMPFTEVIPPSRPMPHCNETLQVETAATGSVAQVNCNQPKWTRSVRLRGVPAGPVYQSSDSAAKAQGRKALGLSRSMAKGEVISADDLVLVELSELAPDQVFFASEDLIGRRLRRAVGAGSTVLARHLEPNWLVLPDANVLILSETKGISVAFKGTATEAGALGDTVTVMNGSSGRTVFARVIGRDMVRVTLKPFKTVP